MNYRLFLLFFVFLAQPFRFPCQASVGNDTTLLSRLSNPSPRQVSMKAWGIEDYPYQQKITSLLASHQPKDWKESGVNKQIYLDMMEKIVRQAAAWVDEKGAIIDPFTKAEFGQTSPRFTSSAAILLYYGRVADLKPLVYRSMSYCCEQLATGKGEAMDFWMRELAVAYVCLQPIAPADLLGKWENLLKAVQSEKVYTIVDPEGKRLAKLHNWAVYSSAGEYVRYAAGLTRKPSQFMSGKDFFEKYMNAQLVHFTPEGMYRDPNDPITYDITTRLQVATALAFGYEGPLLEPYNEILRRGGLTMLLFAAPGGFSPYGGRSSQYQFQEAIVSALSELEARRYQQEDKQLAGAFKRQAHLSALSIGRWITDMEPFRHLKNGFTPQSQHGIDKYGKYPVYSLYCSSVLGLAALFADDAIPERPCPAEIGGFVMELYPAFHKVFATVGDTHIEVDTEADFHYDGTGLGRFVVRGVPIELGLSMPFTAHPEYLMADSLVPATNYAIGPFWKKNGVQVSLADFSENLKHTTTTLQETRKKVTFVIDYKTKNEVPVAVQQRYNLSHRHVNIVSTVQGKGIDSVGFHVPLLVSDGNTQATIHTAPGKVTVTYLGHQYCVTFDKKLKYHIEKQVFANRNGIYRNLVIESKGNKTEVDLELK